MLLTEGSDLRHRPTVVGDDEGLTVLHRSQHSSTVIAQLALADVLGCSGHAGNVARRSTLASLAISVFSHGHGVDHCFCAYNLRLNLFFMWRRLLLGRLLPQAQNLGERDGHEAVEGDGHRDDDERRG